jgi:HxlR-like helix-turn-helix
MEHGVLERRCYDEARDRYDYLLTDKGKALWPVLTTLRQWGDGWIVGQGSEPIQMVHTMCGEHVKGTLHCDHCGEPLHRRDLRIVAGPGMDDESFLPTPTRFHSLK